MTNSLGIVGCQVLEDEIVYMVSHDSDVEHITVIDSTKEKTIVEKTIRNAPDKDIFRFEKLQDIKDYLIPSGMTVLIILQPIALHQSPTLLREEVMKAINNMENVADSVLIFHGQCGNAFLNMNILAERSRVPLTILSDRNGGPVDDCYGTVLGGREEYRDFLIQQPGPAYILNSMWAAHWRQFMQEVQMLHDPDDVEEAREVFKYMDYKSVIGLITGLVDRTIFERQIEEFGRIFGLRCMNQRCTLSVVENSYNEAKMWMRRPNIK